MNKVNVKLYSPDAFYSDGIYEWVFDINLGKRIYFRFHKSRKGVDTILPIISFNDHREKNIYFKCDINAINKVLKKLHNSPVLCDTIYYNQLPRYENGEPNAWFLPMHEIIIK